jgi:hypothetical protein
MCQSFMLSYMLGRQAAHRALNVRRSGQRSARKLIDCRTQRTVHEQRLLRYLGMLCGLLAEIGKILQVQPRLL